MDEFESYVLLWIGFVVLEDYSWIRTGFIEFEGYSWIWKNFIFLGLMVDMDKVCFVRGY
jgi:hypothetical protein